MKNIKLYTTPFLFLFMVTNAMAQTKPQSANVVIKNAIAEAAGARKDVFVLFHASWCGWCHKMENAMNDGAMKTFFNNNYVIVYLTVDESEDKKELENPGANELLQKYHGENQGIPYWFILDSHGNLLADSRKADDKNPAKLRSVGCPAEKDEVDYFVKVLKKTSSLNDRELMLIQQRFLKNKE